jgi:hypothetical protein
MAALNEGPSTPSEAISNLELASGGQHIPQEAIFHLRFRSGLKQLRPTDAKLARLWVSLTKNHVLACHERGKFKGPPCYRVEKKGREVGGRSPI